MLNLYVEPRHWSDSQQYVTGDVLARLLGEGWQIRFVQPMDECGRARLYRITFERDGDSLTARVLDGPAAREALAPMI